MSLSGLDYVEDDDELMKAIALSLQDSAGASCLTHNERKKNAEDTGRQKRKKSFTSRVQMTEDELVIHFYQFDESGKGGITVRDLQKIALAHDFMWTDEELADMIRCFDGDGDGMLNLDDFRKIISRCNMLRGSDTS
ncbi:calmodulin-like protein 3 isoform X2 [Carica papaya]|uniref:calmodulin-like protein 3 isoform X2 n=1 Tax=Carica papaya TaxID=3649 RepID=UPI000B8C8679|nr:calmodulin-like protein 3 isoform X2 [Carica papaya]